MEYYHKLAPDEKRLLDDYSVRIEKAKNRSGRNKDLSFKVERKHRLPDLNSFSFVFNRDESFNLVPTPVARVQLARASVEKTVKRKSRVRRSSDCDKEDVKGFFLNDGVNLEHPELCAQVRKIVQLISTHKAKCRGWPDGMEFVGLRRYFK
jgi:hypothetical protein